MSYLDIILLLPLLWGAFKGFKKGLIIEVATLAALFFGLLGGVKFADFVAHWLREDMGFESEYLIPLSFALIFIGVVMGVFFIGKLTTQAVKAIALNLPNKVAGAGFSILKYGLIISFLLNLINSFDKSNLIISEEIKEESILFEPLSAFSAAVVPTIQNSYLYDFLKDEFEDEQEDEQEDESEKIDGSVVNYSLNPR